MFQVLFLIAAFQLVSVANGDPIKISSRNLALSPVGRVFWPKNERLVFGKFSQIRALKLQIDHPELENVTMLMINSQNRDKLVKLIFEHNDRRLVDCEIIDRRNDDSAVAQTLIRQFGDEVDQNLQSSTNWTIADNQEIEQMIDFPSAEEKCRNFRYFSHRQNSSNRKIRRNRKKRSYLIFPGTNWCGNGNVAKHVAHFGEKSREDVCCKTHDLCPYSIPGFSSRYNLFNYRFHTLSHCDCDKLFMSCLKQSRTTSADIIGKVYFNVVSTQCFELKLEKTCAKRTWWGTCDRQQTQWVAQCDKPKFTVENDAELDLMVEKLGKSTNS
uniref:Phospholipase A2 n=1 Tax=Romanomermis culicivorax TaxID=13658 RepID=A0A915IXZ2_ROMCU